MNHDPAFEEWIRKAKDAPLLEIAELLGARLKRAGHEHVGPCPAGCATTDGFAINPKKNVFLCRPGGASGSVIDLAMHVNGGDFMQACEYINGEPPPRGESRAMDPEVARERQEARKDDQRERAAERQVEERQEQKRRRTQAEKWWDATAPIEGTHAMAYLNARGVFPTQAQAFDLGFIPDAPYHGYAAPDDERQTELGRFPCMVAAIRNLAGDVIGVHRTYLDPERPRKLTPPGDKSQNKAKKVLGEAGGGLIWLSLPAPVVAIAEGIETSLSWYAMWTGGEIALAAAYSLGNMSGAATGTKQHPRKKGTILNGIPDMARPGMRLPPEVREVILLGDGDSDPCNTRAHLFTAGERLIAEGRTVSVSMAPAGQDWNDALMAAAHEDDEVAA